MNASIGNYNNSVLLWQNYRKALLEMPHGGPGFTIHDGMIGNGMQVVARFDNSRAAKECLKQAGFTNHGSYWKA